jgi:hypothetical protein
MVTDIQVSMKTIKRMEMVFFSGLMDDAMMANGRMGKDMVMVSTLRLRVTWVNIVRASDMAMVFLSGLMVSDIQDNSVVVPFMEVL